MKALIYVSLLVCALLFGWHSMGPESPTSPEVADQPAKPQSPIAPLAARANLAPPEVANPQPASLRGTQVDGRLETDYRGNLIVTEQLRHLFDYHFTTVGEISFDQATARIRDYLVTQLQQPAQGQALALLDAYVQYKTDLVELESSYPVIADMDGLLARMDAVERLRAGLFDPLAHSAFFAAEEVYDRFTLERLSILRDEGLTESQKAGLIEDLRYALPGDMQELLTAQIHQTLNVQTAELMAAGADAGEVRQLRMTLVGPQATQRLEALDEQRRQWQQRVEEFSAERQAILDYRGLADADKKAAIEALASEAFEPAERLRLAGTMAAQAGSL